MAIGRIRKAFCLVGRDVTESFYNLHPCSESWHFHLTWPEVREMYDEHSLAPVNFIPKPKGDDTLESDYLFEWLIPGRVIKFKRNPATRGLSSKYGEYLANAVKAKEPWALNMIANQRGQRETASERVLV